MISRLGLRRLRAEHSVRCCRRSIRALPLSTTRACRGGSQAHCQMQHSTAIIIEGFALDAREIPNGHMRRSHTTSIAAAGESKRVRTQYAAGYQMRKKSRIRVSGRGSKHNEWERRMQAEWAITRNGCGMGHKGHSRDIDGRDAVAPDSKSNSCTSGGVDDRY